MTPTISLQRTGQKMPLVGFGLWKLTKSTCADTVYNAIKAGYRLLDGASDYGNEKEAGEGVNRAIKDGLVKREELFITSKLWNTNHGPEHVKKVAKYQLELWGLDKFDLFLMHFPVSLKFVPVEEKFPAEWWNPADNGVHLDNVPIQDTWKAMEELVDDGIAASIGISNFQGSLIIDLLRYARIKPAALQIEHHPYLTQEALIKYAQANDIAVTAYSSFGPAGYIELDMGHGIPSLLEHDVVTKISSAHSKTPAQVLLRWATQRNIAVIPKSNNQERLIANLDCSSFDLSEADIKAISGLNQHIRLNDPADIDPRLAIFA